MILDCLRYWVNTYRVNGFRFDLKTVMAGNKIHGGVFTPVNGVDIAGPHDPQGSGHDLASILGRNEDGSPMNKPPLLQALAFDPILGDVKLIAEAWDADGLYQVGTFPSWNPV